VTEKINEHVTSNKNKNIETYTGIKELKDYKHKSNSAKYDNGELLADSHNILNT
jgi:hypothetical protein